MTIKGVEEKYDLRKTSAKFVPLLVNHLHFGLFPYLGECRCITKQRTSLESTASYTWNFDFVKKMDLNGPVEVFIKKMFRRNWCTDPEIRNDPLLQLICFKNVTYSFIYLFTYSFIHVLFFSFWYIMLLICWWRIEEKEKNDFFCAQMLFSLGYFSPFQTCLTCFFVFCSVFCVFFEDSTVTHCGDGKTAIFYFWPTFFTSGQQFYSVTQAKKTLLHFLKKVSLFLILFSQI